MNKAQRQRAMDVFADDCEINHYYFGLVDDHVDYQGDDSKELNDEGFSEIVQGPTCAIGALIVDLWKSGDLNGESVKNVMLYTNDAGYNDLPDEVQDALQKVYGLDREHFNELQNSNDRVSEKNTIHRNFPTLSDIDGFEDDHISTRESLVISTLLNMEVE
jgi:hypothetical protein